jgi:Fe-S-cluster-containing hydrogenase component 2
MAPMNQSASASAAASAGSAASTDRSTAPVPVLSPELQTDYHELRRLPVFDGIPNEELAAAITAGGIRRVTWVRDRFVADAVSAQEESPPVLFIAAGQVAAAVFEEQDLIERRAEQVRLEALTDEEKEEQSLLQPPPLQRVAKKNLALFTEGDLFNSAALSIGAGMPVAFYTVAPTVAAALTNATISELAARHPFFEARFRRAIQASRDRLKNITGVKQAILDFFVRQGISVSGEMVRVRQLDRCIDCKQCEEACEERYGSRRLTLGGYQLGMLDFIYTCRTCTDQRCIDPCEYDSIKFDPVKKEVVINEASCTGCSMCAQSCPYGAIEMVDVEDQGSPTFRTDFKKRLEKKSALAFGAGTPRVARARRIANKCDHCGAYGDQACISACPTGALIEISAHELFRERPPATQIAARAGYDQEVPSDRREILPTTPFTEGVHVKDGGLAKVRRGRLAPVILWGIGLAAWFLALAEIILRLKLPESSLLYVMMRQKPDLASLPADFVIEKITFRSGSELSIWCGVVGTALMFIAAIYPAFRRIRMFRWLASNTMWFDFHMMAGTVGPLFILLHSALGLDSWVSAAFWSMVIVVLSGVIGRYLYTQVPDLLNGRELEELDHERELTRLRGEHAVATKAVDDELRNHRERADWIAVNAGMWRTLGWLILEDLRRPGRWLGRARRLRKTGAARPIRRELQRRAARMMLVGRRRVLAPRAQLLLHSWKKVHVPFTILMTVISIVHIWDAFPRAF